MSSVLKYHHFRLNITIHEVSISVKFPCSVSATIKSGDYFFNPDSQDIELNKDFKLLLGVAKVQETRTVDVKLVYNSKLRQYKEKKVTVLVYLKSSSGKIPAGTAAIPIKSERSQKNNKINIEKCPDKTANIEYSIALELIRQQHIDEDDAQSRSTSNIHAHETQNSGSIAPITNEIRYSASRDGAVKRNGRGEIFSSRVSTKSINNNHANVRNFGVQDRSERDKPETGSQSHSQSRISRLIMKQHENEVTSQRQKIHQLEKQKTKAMKEIRALKHELETNSIRSSQVSQRQNSMALAKHESRILTLEQEIQKQKSRVSQFQTESHKRKIKIQQIEKDLKVAQKKYEQLQEEVKKERVQKQEFSIKNKQLQMEMRQIKEKYEDQVLAYDNYVKRSEFKQNVYKQQLKTINDKYTVSESEKQKLLFEKSQTLTQYEEKQKKDKEGLRNREKALIQQKNKLIRKIDSLEKQLQNKKQEKDGIQQKVEELQSIIKINKNTLQTQQMALQQLQRENNDLKNQLLKEVNAKKNLQSEVQTISKVEQDKKSLKKSLIERQQQLSQALKTKSNLEISKKALSQKSEELEIQLKQKNAAYKVLQKQFESLSKKMEALKKSEEQKAKQINDITFIKQGEESKVYGLSEDLRELQKKYKNVQMQNSKEIQNLHNKIGELQQQIQENNEKNFMINQQLFASQKNLEELKAVYSSKLTQLSKLQTELQHQRELNEHLRMQVTQTSQLKTQTQSLYDNKVKDLSKVNKQIITENKEIKLTLERTIRQNEETINKLNLQIKNYQVESKAKDKELYELKKLADENQAHIINMTSELESNALQIRDKVKQQLALKERIKKIELENQQLQQKLKQTEYELDLSNKEIKSLQQVSDTSAKQKQQMNGDVKKAKKELDKFKSNNQYSLKTFFNILNQPEAPDIINVTHDDPQIVKSMMEVLKKKKTVKFEYQKQIMELQSYQSSLQIQIEKLNCEIDSRDLSVKELNKTITQFEKQKTTNKRSYQTLQKDHEKVTNDLQKKIENLTNQIENFEKSGNNLSTMMHKKCEQIESLNLQIESKNKMISNLQSKIQLEILKNNKELQNILNTTNSTIDELKAELDIVKLKLQEEESKRNIVTLTNQELQNDINELKQQLIQKQSLNKYQLQSKIEYEKQVERLKKVIIELEERVDEYEFNHGHVNSELEQSNQQVKHLHQKIINLEIVNKGITEKAEKYQARLKENIDLVKEKQKSFEQERKRIQSETRKVSKQLQVQKKDRNNLQTKMEQLQKKVLQLSHQLKQAHKQIGDSSKKLSMVSAENAGQRQKYLKEIEDLNKRLIETVRQKQAEFLKLKDELEQALGERDFLSNSVSCAQKNIEQLIEEKDKYSEHTNKKLTDLQKQNSNLTQDLINNQQQIKILQNNLSEVSRTFENYQLQNNNQVGYMQPIAQKLNKLLADSEEYLQFMNQFQANKNKIIKISNYKIENISDKSSNQIVREINIAAQRCKLQIINKSKIPQQDKNAIVEEFKTLQGSIEKIMRN